MSSIDHEANLLFNAIFTNFLRFEPCGDKTMNTRVACDNCRTTLESSYLEERLYAIRCPDCRTVVLLKAPNPLEAAMRVGYEEKLHEHKKIEVQDDD
jgi:DNA-directed RNA polymerase subunit RPC12/RpoP